MEGTAQRSNAGPAGEPTALPCLPCDVCRAHGGAPSPAVDQVELGVRDLRASLALCARHLAEVDGLAQVLRDRPRERRQHDTAGFPRLRADEDRELIRAWARQSGLPVAASGTISAAVLESFRAAHQTQRTLGDGA